MGGRPEAAIRLGRVGLMPSRCGVGGRRARNDTSRLFGQRGSRHRLKMRPRASLRRRHIPTAARRSACASTTPNRRRRFRVRSSGSENAERFRLEVGTDVAGHASCDHTGAAVGIGKLIVGHDDRPARQDRRWVDHTGRRHVTGCESHNGSQRNQADKQEFGQNRSPRCCLRTGGAAPARGWYSPSGRKNIFGGKTAQSVRILSRGRKG